jgi:Rrf2 family transcriptional regulator, iron-sulfur cluster assembly transcription factor
VQVTARGRYAVMAMVDLAACAAPDGGACPAGRSVTMAEIAERQGISLAFLEQIFCRLRQAGLVSAVRGPGGGYRLARPPAEIPIVAIIRAAGESIRTTRCAQGGAPCMPAPPGEPAGPCRTHDLWAALGREIERFLASVTVADVLASRIAGQDGASPEEAAA